MHVAATSLSIATDCCRVSTSMSCTQAFVEVLASNETFSAPMDATYALLDIEPGSVTTLESYLQVRAFVTLSMHVAALRLASCCP